MKRKTCSHTTLIHSMLNLMSSILLGLVVTTTAAIFVSGCGAGQADSSGGGGGNVGTSGAQDIGLFRKILDEGSIPGEASLDANGFFSEHYTHLPPPECGSPICLQAMLAVNRDWIWGDYRATLQLAFNTTIDLSTLEAKPLDLVVVVDTSGSMATDQKMSYAKQGIHMLINGLDPEDRMALISYDTDVRVLSELQSVEDATALHDAVDRLVPVGMTNFHGGLQTGLQTAADSVSTDRETRVIMLSDGVPTQGITSTTAILEMAEGYIADGIGLTTIGMGLDFNVELMRGLAERGAGNFYFLENSAAIEEVFAEELKYFVTPIADSVSMEVRSGKGYLLGEVSGTKLWETKSYGGMLTIPTLFLAGRIGEEDPGPGRRGGGSSFFVELIPDASQADGDQMVTEITFTYRLRETDEIKEQKVRVEYPGIPGEVPQGGYYSNEAMVKNNAVYNIYKGLLKACRTAETSHNHALWILEELEKTALQWNERYDDDDIADDLVLIQQFQGNLRSLGATPLDPVEYPHGYYAGDDMYYGCSITNGPGSPVSLPTALLMALLSSLLFIKTRKRNI